jgi:uncharacterized membrane protein YkvA (DUF1232 family)
MALKFTEKLKSMEIPRVSAQDIFGRKNTNKEELDNAKQGPAEKLANQKQELQRKVSDFLAENGDKLKQWYSESQMDEKIKAVAKKAGATIIYPVLLLYNLFKSKNVLAKDKMIILAPLAYFILPADLVPDVILGVGFMDDGVAVTTALKTLSSSITPELTDQAKDMCKNLIGEVDGETINGILNKAIDESINK